MEKKNYNKDYELTATPQVVMLYSVNDFQLFLGSTN